jgi:Fur family transcriptional regulator, ferric uptake regulator
MAQTDSNVQRANRKPALLAVLRERGTRMTTPRHAVLDALLDSSSHPTAEALALIVQGAHPEVAVSTIYRTLDHFEEVGLLVHVHLGHGPAVYHFKDEMHVHLVCRLCGDHLVLAPKTAATVTRTIRTSTGFAAELSHFSISGLCRDCQ